MTTSNEQNETSHSSKTYPKLVDQLWANDSIAFLTSGILWQSNSVKSDPQELIWREMTTGHEIAPHGMEKQTRVWSKSSNVVDNGARQATADILQIHLS